MDNIGVGVECYKYRLMMIKDYMTKEPGTGKSRLRGSSHVMEALDQWRRNPSDLNVMSADGSRSEGVLRQKDLLRAMADIFAPSQQGSLIEVSGAQSDYSASLLARAAEDADVAVIGMWSMPDAEPGSFSVIMLICTPDAEPVCRSLKRYGYEAHILGAQAADLSEADFRRAIDNITALKMYLDI